MVSVPLALDGERKGVDLPGIAETIRTVVIVPFWECTVRLSCCEVECRRDGIGLDKRIHCAS